MQNTGFKVLENSSDLAIEVYGSTIQELFKNALVGMFTVLKPQGPHISYQTSNQKSEPTCAKYTVERVVHTRSEGFPMLLVDFLSDCLYLSDLHNEAYFDVRFSVLEPIEVQAKVFGTPVSSYDLPSIKAVTYHELLIEEIEGGWRARLTFDM